MVEVHVITTRRIARFQISVHSVVSTLIIAYHRQGELFWQQNLQKSEGGPSMLEEVSITAVVKEEVDFVLMQTFLFAFTMPSTGLIYQR